MIVIDLSCTAGHRFEGWFPSAAGFDSQLAAGQVLCPHCASTDVRRIPSAVHVARHVSSVPKVSAAQPSHGLAHGAPPAGVTALKAVLDAVLARSENVGNDFANEVRRIHYQEAPERAVHGQASIEECQSLREEGIDVFALPDLGRDDLN